MRAITLSPDPRSAGAARAFVRSVIEGHVADTDDAVLLTSELVSNVIRHAHTDVTVEVEVGPPVRVGVRDGAAATGAFRALMERPTWPETSSVTGRGLSLLRALSSSFGLDDDESGGKVVWFEL